MEINDLVDLKKVLNKIPDDVAGFFGFFVNEDGDLRLGCMQGEDEPEMWENFSKHTKKHPEIRDIDNLLKNMQKELQSKDGSGEPIDNEVKPNSSHD